MAWEGELQRGAKWDDSSVVTTKADAEVLLQFVAAAVTEAGLASGDVVATPELAAMAAFAEAAALRLADRMTETVGRVERKAAAYFAGKPGGVAEAEPLAEALGRCAASVARLRTQAAQFAASARRMASRRAAVEEAEEFESSEMSGSPPQETRTGERSAAGVDEGFGRRGGRKRKRNGRYFGPDWSS